MSATASGCKARMSPGRKFTGMRAGIVGLGRIGSEIARRLEGFKTTIGYVRPGPARRALSRLSRTCSAWRARQRHPLPRRRRRAEGYRAADHRRGGAHRGARTSRHLRQRRARLAGRRAGAARSAPGRPARRRRPRRLLRRAARAGGLPSPRQRRADAACRELHRRDRSRPWATMSSAISSPGSPVAAPSRRSTMRAPDDPAGARREQWSSRITRPRSLTSIVVDQIRDLIITGKLRARRPALRKCARRTARGQPDAGPRGLPAACTPSGWSRSGRSAAPSFSSTTRPSFARSASCARCSRRERCGSRLPRGRDELTDALSARIESAEPIDEQTPSGYQAFDTAFHETLVRADRAMAS